MTTQFINAAQLAHLRRLNERAMPDSVTIRIPSAVVADGRGGFTEPFSDGPTVACRFRPSSQKSDQVEGGQGGNQELYVFTFPVGTVVGVTYRIRRNDITYEVIGEPTDSSHQIGLHVLARKI